MNLLQLVKSYSRPALGSVPEWTINAFRRASISFANGLTDTDTQVWWLQSRNFTVDLRLPAADVVLPNKAWVDYSAEELRLLANCEGWCAPTQWNNGEMSWLDAQGPSLQWHNRWTEPGLLHRIGNNLIEFSPTGAYVEEWRAQEANAGPLIGLRLLHERNLSTGEVTHLDGGLVVNGTTAGFVKGRPQARSASEVNSFRETVVAAKGDAKRLASLFQFETSIARGDITQGFKVRLSTNPARLEQPLLSMDGFEWRESTQQVLQQCEEQGDAIERVFSVDALEPEFQYGLTTPWQEPSKAWFASEQETLGRYLKNQF